MSNDCSAWWSDLIKRSATEGATSEYLAWCEIERLTAEVAKWQEQAEVNKHDAHNFHDIVVQKDKRIEDMKFDHEQITALEVTERDRMRRRIEELEQDRSLGLEERGYHIITTEQIDAAWEWNVLEIMAELNIVACEECGGCGSMWAPWDEQVPITCHSCHGHGWVVK